MAFSAVAHASSKSDMNIVPLIDVLLVLLIIFMVTSPLLSFEIPIDLPQDVDRVKPQVEPPAPINLRIDASGALFWDNLPLPRTALEASLQIEPPAPINLRIDASGALFWDNLPLPRTALEASLQIETLGKSVADQPMLKIDASPDAEYHVLAEVLAVAKNVGVAKIGFVGAL